MLDATKFTWTHGTVDVTFTHGYYRKQYKLYRDGSCHERESPMKLRCVRDLVELDLVRRAVEEAREINPMKDIPVRRSVA